MTNPLEDINSLPVEQKVGQLFFIGIPGPAIDDLTEKLISDISPGGICLFARNIKEAEQTRSLLDDLSRALAVQPFLSVDQEGGLVDRLRRLITPMPAANKIVTEADASEMGSIIAEALRILGFNMDFAPVVDVIDESRTNISNGLFSRAFGRSPEEVVELAGAFLSALGAGGCVGSLKHFPGLGASEVDSHEELPSVNVSQEEFEATDLFPYRKLVSAASHSAIMVAHASYPTLDLQEMDRNGKLLPSSLSRNVVSGLLREKLGFDGLVITDDLEMGAILKNYGIGEACKMAIAAGVDMLAICAGVDSIYEGYKAVSAAVVSGEIGEERLNESLQRIAIAKSRLSDALIFDQARLGSLSDRVAEINARLN